MVHAAAAYVDTMCVEDRDTFVWDAPITILPLDISKYHIFAYSHKQIENTQIMNRRSSKINHHSHVLFWTRHYLRRRGRFELGASSVHGVHAPCLSLMSAQ